MTKNLWVCVDACLVVKVLVPNPLEEQVEQLFQNWQEKNIELIAPTHMIYEVVSTLRQMVYFKHLSPSQGQQAFDDLLGLNIRTTSTESMIRLAWELATRFSRPRAYDALYLAVAQIRQCEFWTADKRVYNAVKQELPWVRCVG